MVLTINQIDKKLYIEKSVKMIVTKAIISDNNVTILSTLPQLERQIILDNFRCDIINTEITNNLLKITFSKNITIRVRKESKDETKIFAC